MLMTQYFFIHHELNVHLVQKKQLEYQNFLTAIFQFNFNVINLNNYFFITLQAYIKIVKENRTELEN